MHDFRYSRAAEVGESIELLKHPDTALIAGGTEILNWLRLGIASPGTLVDIGRVGALSGIAADEDALAIRAGTTLAAIGDSPLVAAHANVLREACLKAASPQIRNRASIGGNVLQKTRCAYFRAEAPLPWGCNKRAPGTGCAAREGLNEGHAIFGWSDACVATQPSDPAVALACLDAEVRIAGPAGERRLAMTDFHLSQEEGARVPDLPTPGHSATRETRLGAGEIILGFRIPIRTAKSAYVKVRERESYEYALVSAAAAVEVEDGVIASARIALGSVAQKPWRLPDAEAALAGVALSRDAVLPPIRDALSAARPLEHNGWKVDMAAGAALRAVMTAGGVA